MDLNQTINHLRPGEEVSPTAVSAVTKALEQRLIELQNQVLALAGGDQVEFLNNVRVSTDLKSYQMAYYNPATRLYEPALSLAILSPNGATIVQSSYCCGMVINVANGYADLAYNGVLKDMYIPLDDTSKITNLLEPGIEWLPGRRYFLSETHPGRITHRQTALEISVGRSGENEFFVDLNEQPPQVRSYTERTTVSMRPVGDTRPLEDDSERLRIVAFDGVENSTGDTWISTRESNDDIIKGNGWLRADMRWVPNTSERLSGILVVYRNAGASDLQYWFVDNLSSWDITDPPTGTISGLDTGKTNTISLSLPSGELGATVTLGMTSNDTTRKRITALRVPDAFIGWKEFSEPNYREQYGFYWEGTDGQLLPVYTSTPYPNQAFAMSGSGQLFPVEAGTDFYEGGNNPDPNWEWSDVTLGRLRPMESPEQHFSKLAESNTGLPEVQCAIYSYPETFPNEPDPPVPLKPLFGGPKFLPQNPDHETKVREFRMIKLSAPLDPVLPDGLLTDFTLVKHEAGNPDVIYPVKAVLSSQFLVLDWEGQLNDGFLDLTDGVTYELFEAGVSYAGVDLIAWLGATALYWSVFECDEQVTPDLRNSIIRVTGKDGRDITKNINNGFVHEVRVWGVIGSRYVVSNVQFSEIEFGASYQVYLAPMYYYNTPTDITFSAGWPKYDHAGTVFIKNGVELQTSALDESSGEFYEPNTVVGYSRLTLYWNPEPVSNRPWNEEYIHLAPQGYELPPGTVLPPRMPKHQLAVGSVGVGILWEPSVDAWTYVNRGAIYTNNISRKLGAGYIRSLSVQPPLVLSQVGYDGNYSNVGQTGHVHLRLSNQYSILGSATFSAVSPSGVRYSLFRNRNNTPVVVTSLFAYCQAVNGTVNTTPLVDVGTADGFRGNTATPYRQFLQDYELLPIRAGQAQIIKLDIGEAFTLVNPSIPLTVTLTRSGKVTLQNNTPGEWDITLYAAGYILT